MNRNANGQRGITLMEMMVSILASLIVVMALGRVMTINSQAYDSNRDKSDSQSNASLILERMTRATRQASVIEVVSSDEFRVRDGAGNVVHTYSRSGSGSGARLQEDGVDMSPEACTQFSITADSDTTSLLLSLTLAGDDGSTVSTTTRVAQRMEKNAGLPNNGNNGGPGGPGNGNNDDDFPNTTYYSVQDQEDIRTRLSLTLKGVISQQLLPLKEGEGRVAAREVMFVTHAIANMIREAKIHQINNMISAGMDGGMVLMDDALLDLHRQGLIRAEDVLPRLHDTEKALSMTRN